MSFTYTRYVAGHVAKYRMLFTLVILEGGEVPLAPMWYRLRL